jgi:arylsulfatase
MFWEHMDGYAVRWGKYKALKHKDKETWELYDLQTDRTETTDLASVNPEILEKLKTKWLEWANANYVFPKGIADSTKNKKKE